MKKPTVKPKFLELNVEQTEDFKNLRLTLIVYCAVFAMKLTVYFLSGVMALLAEAMHTMTDIFVTGFLFLALIFSRKKADDTHMFGHGRAQNIAALVASVMFVTVTCLKLVEEAVPRLVRPQAPSYSNLPLVIGVLAVSMLIAAAPLIRLLVQKKKGAAAKAQLVELINDQLGLVTVLIGTVMIMTGIPLADPIATLVVAAIILVNAVKLFVENFSYLLGRVPSREYLEMLRETASSVPGVLGIHAVRAEVIGPGITHVDFHIEVRKKTTVEEAGRITDSIQRETQKSLPGIDCTIHVDAAEEQGRRISEKH